MHCRPLSITLSLLAGALAFPWVVARQLIVPQFPPLSESKGFTLVVNVTGNGGTKDFSPSINLNTLSSIHVGAGLGLAAVSPDSARIWYLNGTQQEGGVSSDTVVTDGGTPLFPNGLSLAIATNHVSAIAVNAGSGTAGIGLTALPNPYAYLTAPGPGTYAVCNQSVPYYQGRRFLLLNFIGSSEGSEGASHGTPQVPHDCVAVRLLPQCTELPALPVDAISNHEFAKGVGCYENVAAIDWARGTVGKG